MSPLRRHALLLAGLPALAVLSPPGSARAAPPRGPLQFPADFGAHPAQQTEWWYVTGWLAADGGGAGAAEPDHGFQVTFFRSRTAVPPDHPSAFAAHQLIVAHTALTDRAGARLLHDQRIARQGFGLAHAATGDTRLTLRDWQLRRNGPVEQSRYQAQVRSVPAGYALELELAATQPPLLQGDQGWSQKGPQPGNASRYYTQPQLQAKARLQLRGSTQVLHGRAWLDHEWADRFLDDAAVGWDWLGINLHDGAALTVQRMRRADGSALWAGGSFRTAPDAGGRPGLLRSFGPGEVVLTPLRTWTSPATRTTYPVQWRVHTPAGTFTINALLDAQEQDSRASTGMVYWEGLSELLDERGRRVGLGYLELTGYQQKMRL